LALKVFQLTDSSLHMWAKRWNEHRKKSKHHSSGLDSPGHYDAVKEAVLIASDLMERIEDQEWERAVKLAKAGRRRSGREVQE